MPNVTVLPLMHGSTSPPKNGCPACSQRQSRTLRPKPKWFLTRGIPLGLFALLIFAAAPGAAVLGVMSVIGAALSVACVQELLDDAG